VVILLWNTSDSSVSKALVDKSLNADSFVQHLGGKKSWLSLLFLEIVAISHIFGAVIIGNLSVASSRYVKSQFWTKSDRDSLSQISISKGGTIKRSPPSCRQPFIILLSPTRRSKDASESSTMATFHVMRILTLVDRWQDDDSSGSSSLTDVHC
jgi:hypothetical protein